MENFIIYGVYIYLTGMLVSAGMSLLRNHFRFANAILFLSNLAGFSAMVAYLANFPGRELVILQTGFFFDLKLSLDYLSSIFLLLTSGISGLVVVYSAEYLDRYRKTYDIQSVQSLMGIFIFGMVGVLLSANVVGFMVFWEIMSFASFFLVMSDRTKESLHAAFIYFVMTHLGAGAILGGFLILSGGSLGFEISGIAAASRNIPPDFLTVAFLLFFFGFGSKAGLIPFHIWLPEAHPQAPTNISALMSGLMLKIAVYGFLKTVMMFFHIPIWAALLVISLGIISALLGALYAVVEKDIKKAFAYSSIENMGIIFLMLGMAMCVMAKRTAGEIPLAAILLVTYAIFHAINHAIFKTGLFLSSGVIINRTHSKSLDMMGGLAKAMPIFSFIFLIIILASAALPPFGTFYGEWGFIRALIDLLQISGTKFASVTVFLTVLALFALVSGLATFAMIKIYAISMLGLPKLERHSDEKTDDGLFVIPLAVIGFVMVALGIFAKNILGWLSGHIGEVFFGYAGDIPDVQISSAQVFVIVAAFLLLSAAVYKLLSGNGRKEREYDTWNCGQPIDASMEYTATAFSAPIRFFFLPLLQRRKTIISVPVVNTNPWISKKSFSLDITSVWYDRLYKPAAKYVFWLAEKVRLVHTGRIQYYLLLLLSAIIITLMIAL
ncbi:MAG: proton-conducting transporter membrane subunit [Candidatus Moranbacteria bacterium]|nr:proton-conducting transporter membrane subunit [Candidatus Moranbacteria bacterium]